MKRNTASQTIGAQLVSATDGSAVTSGTATVSVTIDGGTQASGSGTVAHEGNGYWSYAPTQAETNGDHVAFTFVNSSAISVTVQVYTTFPQTGDSYARLGAPAGASVSADIADIESRIPDALVNGRIDATVDGAGMEAGAVAVIADGVCDEALSGHTTAGTLGKAISDTLEDTGTTLPATLSTIAGYIDNEVAAIKAVTDNLPDSGALTSLATAADLATVDTVVDAIKVKTDSLTFTKTGEVDANLQSVNGVGITGDGSTTPFDVA